MPYVLIGFVSFLTLVLLGIFVFGVPVKGSWLALISGAVIYLAAATAFGLLVSTVTRTQVAAIFATAIIALIPATQFSGLLVPVSSLSGAGLVSRISMAVRLMRGAEFADDLGPQMHVAYVTCQAYCQPRAK